MSAKQGVLWVVFLVLCSMSAYAAEKGLDPASVDLVDVPKDLPPIDIDPPRVDVEYVKNVETVTRVGVVDVVRTSLVPTMFVGGTEYEYGDAGKSFVILSINGQSVNDAQCIIEIFYPNMTLFLPFTTMLFAQHGIYYHDFIVPNTTGVYPVNVLCTYRVNTTTNVPFSLTRTLGAGAGALGNIQVIDGAYVGMNENAGDLRRVSAFFNYTTNFNTSVNTLSSITLDFVGRRVQQGLDPVSDPVVFWLYNFNTSQYDLIGNDFSYLASDTTKSYSFLSTSKNLTNYIKNGGSMIVLINDTVNISGGDLATTDMNIDYLALRLIGKTTNETVFTVNGGGEVHVTDHGQLVIQNLQDTPMQIGVSGKVLWYILFFLLLALAIGARSLLTWWIFGLYAIFFGFSLASGSSRLTGIIIIFVGLASLWIGKDTR